MCGRRATPIHYQPPRDPCSTAGSYKKLEANGRPRPGSADPMKALGTNVLQDRFDEVIIRNRYEGKRAPLGDELTVYEWRIAYLALTLAAIVGVSIRTLAKALCIC